MLLPIFCWLLLQMLVLLAAVRQWALAANFPHPAEQAALNEMLLVQFLLSALLMPWLMRRASTAAAAAVSAIPFVSLAAFLSGEQAWRKIVAVTIAVVVWMAALAFWRAAVRGTRGVILVSALAAMLVVAGPLLDYLRVEFSSSGAAIGGEFGPGFWQWSPFMASRRLQIFPFSLSVWVFFGGYLLSGIIVWAIRQKSSHKFKKNSTFSHNAPTPSSVAQ